VSPPRLDHDLCLLEAVEDLPVEQLIAELAVEALDVAILPGTARLDVSGLSSDGRNPFSDRGRNELGAVI
jgi:hypothetical protein